MSEISDSPSKIYKDEATLASKPIAIGFSPIIKIIMSIVVAFLGTVGYETYQGLQKY